LDEFASLQQIAVAARRNLSRGVWDYLMGGSESEITLKRNRMAFDTLGIAPRILRDVAAVDPSTSFMGHKIRIPVMMAPIGSMQLIGEGGAKTVAEAAGEFGTISFLSSVTEPAREVVGPATDAPKVFQLYVRGDDDWISGEVKAAEDAGFSIFCLTVDTAVYSRRERDMIKRWAPSSRRGRLDASRDWQAALSWDNVKRFKERHDIPLILKGIASAEDALIAVEHGVEVVYVSNHGGRQLDHGRGTAEILPEIVEAVAGKAQVLVDGGIMRGTDVIKALALGADAVCIGKLQGLALAAGGKAALVRMLELLEGEIMTSMALTGLHNFGEIGPEFVEQAETVVDPNVYSQYTHIDLPPLEYDR
jgi:isopentenyl diphosphate isomerase/L-lactate dehydrogenase-like FMN-dependent dehydrogenase